MPIRARPALTPWSRALVVTAAAVGLSALFAAGAAAQNAAGRPVRPKPTVVLFAHSYGGAVITNAATGNPNVKALVYVAAFIPDAGEVGADLFKLPGSRIVLPPSPDATVTARPFPGGLDFYVNAGPFREIFAADLPAAETALLTAAQRPLGAAAFTDASGPPTWKTIPAWALVATQDNTIGTANTRFMANRAAPSHTVEVAASPAVLLSQPQAVVDLIERAVRGM
jgi:pimeloyl-ACP methyl ester carboxylesterase